MIGSENRDERIYTVVKVSHGVAEDVYNFRHIKDAQRRLKQLEKGLNIDEDDVQIFENEIKGTRWATTQN